MVGRREEERQRKNGREGRRERGKERRRKVGRQAGKPNVPGIMQEFTEQEHRTGAFLASRACAMEEKTGHLHSSLSILSAACKA